MKSDGGLSYYVERVRACLRVQARGASMRDVVNFLGLHIHLPWGQILRALESLEASGEVEVERHETGRVRWIRRGSGWPA